MIRSGMAFDPSRRLFAVASMLAALYAGAACRKTVLAPPPVAAAQRRPAVESNDLPRQARAAPGRHRVILIGLDGADWSLLDRLAAAGRMPNLQRLAREGRTARLKSAVPLLSPIIWTSIATGMTPDRHGVLDFLEVDQATGLAIPVSGLSRRVPAVWNVASSAGLRVGVVGWWATHPAEEVEGFFVSDHASSILFEGPKEALAYPPALAEGVRRILEEETAVPDPDLLPYVRMSAAEVAAQRARGGGLENPVEALSKILGATRTVQRIARELYDREAPDLTAVYFEGTDVIGHVFAADIPPRLACVSDDDFRRYSTTVDAYYETVDRLLGQWMRRAHEDGATLLVCSDHGFKWGEDRTCRRSSLNWATAAFWHRLDGVLALWGDRVKPAPARGEASIYDLAPTLSALLGLPVDAATSGHPLLAAFDGVAAPARRNLSASISVRRLPASAPLPAEANEYARKLRALGYLSGSESKSAVALPEGPWPRRTEGAWNNLGILQRESGRLAEAERSFREALRMKPGYSSPMFNLAGLERTRGHYKVAQDWLFRSLEAGHAEPEQTILQWVSEAVAAKRRPDAVALLETGTARYPDAEPLAVALARLRFEARDCRGAVSALERFERSGGRDALNVLGLSELCLGDKQRARAHFERSLAIDAQQQPIREALRLIAGGA